MDLTFQVPMLYCSLQYSIYFHHQSHPQQGIVFALAEPLHSFWSYFPAFLKEHIGHLLTWEVHLSVSYLFAFSYCSRGSQSKTKIPPQPAFPIRKLLQASYYPSEGKQNGNHNHRKLIKLITWTTALSNSTKL